MGTVSKWLGAIVLLGLSGSAFGFTVMGPALLPGSSHGLGSGTCQPRQSCCISGPAVPPRLVAGTGRASSHNAATSCSMTSAGDASFFSERARLEGIQDSFSDVMLTQGAMLVALKKRQRAVESGAGRRFEVVTLSGYMPVHESPENPVHDHTVICQLPEGEILESIGPSIKTKFGEWIHHQLGWSIREYNGFQWLRPVD